VSASQTGGRKKTAPASATAKSKPKAKARPAAQAPKRAKPKDDASIEKLSALCLALPDTKLTMTWGSPHFRVGEKIFCGFGVEPDGAQVMSVKLARDHAQRAVKEARFKVAPYVGKHGWVTLDVRQRKSWAEISALIRESYELIAPKASRAKLR
jgi:predicted DNA-binding protein (MmcQ/YjbR family)